MKERILTVIGLATLLAGLPSSRAQQPVKEDWESQPTAPNQHLRSGAEAWQLSRGEGSKEGKAEIVEGKGRKKSKALCLAPDGEEGMVAYASVTLPAVPVQEFRFSMRGDGEGPPVARLFLKLGGRKEMFRVNIGEGKVSINNNSRATLGLVLDEEGWLNVGLKLDRKALTATLRVGNEEKTLEIPAWEEAKIAFQFTVNFKRGGYQQPVLIDEISWLGEGESLP